MLNCHSFFFLNKIEISEKDVSSFCDVLYS